MHRTRKNGMMPDLALLREKGTGMSIVAADDLKPAESDVGLTAVRAAKAGDRRAFRLIVEHHHRLVVSVAYRLSGDPDLADDIAQETFVRAWRNLPRFEPRHPGSLRSWLCRIAHNLTMDAMRRRRTEALSGRRPDQGPTPFDHVSRSETRRAVQDAILRLPDHYRGALVLREFEGLTYAEIAEALDIPIGTVMSRLHGARRRLAVDLAPMMKTGADQ